MKNEIKEILEQKHLASERAIKRSLEFLNEVLPNEIKPEDICKAISMVGQSNAWQHFIFIKRNYRLRKDTLIEGFKNAYNLAYGNYKEIRPILKKYSREDFITSEEEKQIYNDLPDEITIYRGGNRIEEKEGYGFSWSLNQLIAEFFAFRFDVKDTAVYSSTINKMNIKAIITGRNEEEVLWIPDSTVKVLTTKPILYKPGGGTIAEQLAVNKL